MNIYIMYMTNRCNLKCPNCYERQGKEKRQDKIISYDEINQFISNISKEEPDQVSTLCIFGGEPLLEIEKVYYVFNLVKFARLHYDKAIALNIVSNGTLVHKCLPVLKEILSSTEVSVSLDISYDGINQKLRTPNSDIVEKNIELLNKNNLSFGISYTVTSNNYSNEILIKDMVTIFETFFANKNNNRRRLILSVDYSALSKTVIAPFSVEIFREQKRDICNYLYSKYHVPICEVICDTCKRCQKNLEGKQYMTPGSGIIKEGPINNHKFNHF